MEDRLRHRGRGHLVLEEHKGAGCLGLPGLLLQLSDLLPAALDLWQRQWDRGVRVPHMDGGTGIMQR